MRIAALVLLAMAAFADAQAQNAIVRGYVTDASDGQPLQGVNVRLTNDAGALLGGATDRDGFYAVSGIPAGEYYFAGSFIGYSAHLDTLVFEAGEIRPYNFELQFGQLDLEELLVEAEREAAGAAGLTGGLQSVRPQDISLIPAPDLSGDLASYLVTMPGVVAGGDQGGQLFIRGGEPTQNLVLMDGMLVYQPFHLIGFYSAIPASILNVTDVYAGGFGAKYGGRLSSVIDVSTRNGNNRRLSGEISAAPFISAGVLEGPIIPGRVSALFSGRFSVIERGASRIVDTPLPYNFNDQFGKIHAELGQNNRASITGIRSFDQGIIGAQTDAEADSVSRQVTWENTAFGGRYVLVPTRIPVQAEILISSSRVRNSFGQEEDPERSADAREVNVSANVTHFTSPTDITWGLYFRFNELQSTLGGLFQDIAEDTEFVSEAGGYVELDLTFPAGSPCNPGCGSSRFQARDATTSNRVFV